MFHKIIATILTFSLVSSLTFAQEMPGTATLVVSDPSEEMLILNSAPSEPESGISEIVITSEVDEALFTFSTDDAVPVVIEYGLSRDAYSDSLFTEPQKTHTETIGGLEVCSKYYYLVRAGDSSVDGSFDTLCPVVKKIVKKVIPKPLAKEIPPIIPTVVASPDIETDEGMVVDEADIVLNAAPEGDDASMMDAQIKEAPVSAVLPGPIAFGDKTLTTEKDGDNSVPVGLLLFALLSGMVVAFTALKKKKKWYQK